MKGIQVSIDVSESEIVPKAFQRPAVSGGPGSRCLCECVFCGRQAQKYLHTQAGRSRQEEQKTKKIVKKVSKKIFGLFFKAEGGWMKVFCPVSKAS